MLQVIVPLPERTSDGAKMNSRLVNIIESDFLNSIGNFAVTHGQIADGVTQQSVRFYAFSIEPNQMHNLRSAVYRAKRTLDMNEVIMTVTELDTITIN